MMIFQILSCYTFTLFAQRLHHHLNTNWPKLHDDVGILIDDDIVPSPDFELLRHQKRDFDFGNIFDLNKEATVCETAIGPQIGFTCDVCETLASKSSEVKRKMRRKRSQRMKKLHQNVKKHCINILPCCIKLRLYNIIA